MSLCTLAEAKLQLGKTSTADDVELQSYIDAVTSPIEEYCGPVAQRTVTEFHNPFSSTISLRQVPFASVTTVTEYLANTGFTLTQISDPTGASAYSCLVESNGIITRFQSGGVESPFLGRVKVVYTAGYATVPTEINLAARILVQTLWRTQNGGAGLPALTDEADANVVITETMRSPRVRMLLDGHRRIGGIA